MKRVRGMVYQRDKKRSDKFEIRVEYRDKFNKRKRESETFYGKKRDAEARKDQLIEELYKRENFFNNNPSNEKLSDYMPLWVEKKYSKGEIGYTTYIRYKSIINKHLVPILGDITLLELTPEHIENLMYQELTSGNKRRSSGGGLSSTTVRQHYMVLSGALQEALNLKRIPYNPSRNCIPPKPNKVEPFIFSRDQLFTAFERVQSSYIALPVFLGAITGARLGEILALTWPDISFEKRYVDINKAMYWDEYGSWHLGNTKNKSARKVSITAEDLIVLQAYKDMYIEIVGENGFVCCHLDGSPMSNERVSDRFSTIMNNPDFRNGVLKVSGKDANKSITFHCLRHTHITHLIMSKMPLKEVSTRVGHKSVAFTLMKYCHLVEELQEESAKVFSGLLNGAAHILRTDGIISKNIDNLHQHQEKTEGLQIPIQ